MKLGTRKKILTVLAVVVVFLPVLKQVTRTGAAVSIAFYVIEAVLLVALWLLYKGFRCPHCRKSLGFGNNAACPHCKEPLE